MCAATRRSDALQDASADAGARDETEVRPRPDRRGGSCVRYLRVGGAEQDPRDVPVVLAFDAGDALLYHPRGHDPRQPAPARDAAEPQQQELRVPVGAVVGVRDERQRAK